MTLSELCVRRPVMTVLLTLALVLSGVLAYASCRWRRCRASISRSSTCRRQPAGRRPDTMASSVAAPLEREFSTIAGIDTIIVDQRAGLDPITLQFDLDRNIDAAALDVQAALARAARAAAARDDHAAELPQGQPGRRADPVPGAELAPRCRSRELDDYAETMIAPRLSTLHGVAQVLVFGAQKFAVRVQLDPDALAAKGIGIDEVADAVAAANANTPVGTLTAQQPDHARRPTAS